ncbi:hypothetical protein [Bacillus sp. T33-2]|uniref:hypothetical protein n=1 Tax=Bacillus sp. T33-2 TaxID=2054168 RepID=UPI000C785F77|nr:hypothetical protein [Bacillus sp. T33-2]PLR99496.1 hypothetical protein CVD19_00095 [Bacillus sp. T33-2]
MKYRNQKEVRTVFDNTHEKQFNPNRQWYAIVEVDGVEKLYRAEGRVRSAVIRDIEREARKDQGKVLMVGSIKN